MKPRGKKSASGKDGSEPLAFPGTAEKLEGSEHSSLIVPSWIPDGWQIAADLYARGSRKFTTEVNRLFNLDNERYKSFWADVDGTWHKRARAHKAISLEVFRLRIMLDMLYKGGELPAQSVAAILKDRKEIAAAIKRLRALLSRQPYVAQLRVTDFLRFAVDKNAEQDDPKSFGMLDAAMQLREEPQDQRNGLPLAAIMYIRSPKFAEMLLALENRLVKGKQLGAFDPLVHRNVAAPQSGRANARQILFETTLQVTFMESTGKPHNKLVAIGVEMAFGLPVSSVSADIIRGRRRDSTVYLFDSK